MHARGHTNNAVSFSALAFKCEKDALAREEIIYTPVPEDREPRE